VAFNEFDFEVEIPFRNERGLMIFLDITPNDFFEKFPSLGSIIKSKCKSENLPVNEIKPYITKDYIGAILNPDKPNRIKCFTPRDNLSSHLIGSLVSDVLQQ